jgi:hypothetical protein
MTASPNVLKITLDPCPKEICVEFYRKRYVRRKELRNPPSSGMRSSRRTNIWKNSEKNIK